ncbi:telomere length regulation protein [Diaporthe helianthi]|uniref:Telomere length regulation protein n=1 Tax=Diaporthe helianthi TaxID=158607 RepID=A0A2P5IB76_DIAHE|nr:telomere length regulation protein [Diaporthe helianthi]
MDELLRPISRTYTKSGDVTGPLLQEVRTSTRAASTPNFKPKSVPDIVEALNHEPDYDTLVSALKSLSAGGPADEHFNVGAPGPQAARIIQILVTEIVPNYWAVLKESSSSDGPKSGLPLLLGILQNLAGLNAILLRLRTLTQEHKSQETGMLRSDVVLNLKITLELLCAISEGDDSVSRLWTNTSANSETTKQRILSKDFVNVIAGGRTVSFSAEAETIVSQETKDQGLWIANGISYTKWLGRNIISWSKRAEAPVEKKLLADLLSKALRLGYSESVAQLLLADIVNKPQQAQHISDLFGGLASTEQRTLLFTILKIIADIHLNQVNNSNPSEQPMKISAAAGIINLFVGNNTKHLSHLVTWLTSATGAGLGDAIGIRRAVLAVVSSDRDTMATVFEKSLSQFGDYLYIRHTPVLQQEVHAQVLLLSAGYVQRLAPVKFSLAVRSGLFMNMVSKRLEASQIRARLLGMIVGEALSNMAHKDDKKLNFNMVETNSDEALWYKSLVETSDVIGAIQPLASKHEPAEAPQKKTEPFERIFKPAPTPKLAHSKAKAIIEEVNSDEEDGDDIVPLAKPADDEMDSDEDPETVQRDKPKAPVYIRNLITYLRDTEGYDHQRLALTIAPTLIRRKANFGTEVKEHAEELASLLVGVQDNFDIENFYDLKLQGMIAILVAQPQVMGPWFARTFFSGDYSVAQRASVLTVLGLSAREISGHTTSEYAAAASFPSQTLPDKMKKLYVEDSAASNRLTSSSSLKALPANALDTISKSLSSDFMAPLAADAADSVTGPDALKLSTFKSRLGQQPNSTTTQVSRGKPRVRAIPNTTAQLIATLFFFPLTARFQSAARSTAGRSRGIVFQPFLLSLFIKTLAILLHAAGPSTLSLPDMTAELWELLLGSSVRAHAVGDLGVTHAVLFALLTLLEVNGDRMRDICQSMPREVVETQEWVAQIFAGTRGEDGGEENDVKMLAAGVLIRIREGMDKHRALLMGELIG